MPGHDEHAGRGGGVLEEAGQLGPLAVGQGEVGEYGVEAAGAQQLDALSERGARGHVEAAAPQLTEKRALKVSVVLHEEQARRLLGVGLSGHVRGSCRYSSSRARLVLARGGTPAMLGVPDGRSRWHQEEVF